MSIIRRITYIKIDSCDRFVKYPSFLLKPSPVTLLLINQQQKCTHLYFKLICRISADRAVIHQLPRKSLRFMDCSCMIL